MANLNSGSQNFKSLSFPCLLLFSVLPKWKFWTLHSIKDFFKCLPSWRNAIFRYCFRHTSFQSSWSWRIGIQTILMSQYRKVFRSTKSNWRAFSSNWRILPNRKIGTSLAVVSILKIIPSWRNTISWYFFG